MYKKILFFFIFTILSLTYVYATQLGISPGNLDFKGKINERICKDFNIQSDYNGNLIGDLTWLKGGKRENIKKIEYYTLYSNEIGIRDDFIKDITFKKNSLKKEICLSFSEPGKYNGALVYKTQDSYAGVGLWINAEINKEGKKNSGLEKITGLSLLGIGSNGNKNNLIYFVFSLTLIFLTILLTLVFVRKVKV
ncbi:hypothetical protein GOV12_04405 [Candidatus Pacearchaeota archaeon]|nr:hypothetical protein [Candidatus Pacearchaeota archaeon]